MFGRPCGPNAVDVRGMVGYLPTHPQLPGTLKPISISTFWGSCIGFLPRCVSRDWFHAPRRSSGSTDQQIQSLSTGQVTRLGIAASLVADPPLLLWDEPTAGLDPAARRFTLDLIRELGKTRTVVISTHILSDIDQICDHVGVMHEGRVIFCGPMRDMKRRLRHDDFSLELSGDQAAIRRVADEVRSLPGVAAQLHAAQTLVVGVESERSRAAALAEVLRRVDAAGLSLQAIHSGLNETENAYLQLLQEDESHGFHRFDVRLGPRMLPFLAILSDLHAVGELAGAVLADRARAANHRGGHQQWSRFRPRPVASLLFPYLVFPGSGGDGAGSESHLGFAGRALADGFLSRPVTRRELLAVWAARVVAVLALLLVMIRPWRGRVGQTARRRPTVTLYGIVAA